MRRRGVPDAVGGIRLACRHADDGGADYGAVTPAVAHYGADANSDYPACSGVRLCAKEEAGAPGLTAGIDAEFRHAVCAASSGTAVVGSWVEHVRIGALFSGGNIAAGIAGTLAGGLLMKYTSPGRALLTAYGVQGIALLAVVMTLMMAPGHLLLQILQCLVIVQSISLACAGLSLRHADVAFIAFAGRCRLHPLSMY